MPSSFNNQFASGDVVLANHVKQLIPAVEGLETAQAFYRPDISGQATFMKVDFSGTGPGNLNAIDSYQEGQLVIVKAAFTITDPPWLEIVGPSGQLGAKQLVKPDGQYFEAGEIVQGQIFAAVYRASDDRFQVLGGGGGSQGGGLGLLLFGDGSDGDVTFSTDDELTEHKYYNNLTIESGVTLRANGFKIHVKGLLTLDGRIEFHGRDAGDANGSDPGWPGGNPYWEFEVNWDQLKGGEGSINNGQSSPVIPIATVYFARGGTGGDGSVGSGGDDGGGARQMRSQRVYQSLPAILSGISDGGLTQPENVRMLSAICGGTGGGGGSGDGNSNAGGSGGGGGGVLWVAARRLAGNGGLDAHGGRGGDAGGPDAGGGGGGGAGVIYLLTSDPSYPYWYSLNGGDGGQGGGGAGTDGAPGADGLMIFRGGL